MLELENKIQAAAEEKQKHWMKKMQKLRGLNQNMQQSGKKLKASGTAKQSDYQKLKRT